MRSIKLNLLAIALRVSLDIQYEQNKTTTTTNCALLNLFLF